MPEATERLNAALAGRYAIEREIGEGGMATVFLARDLKHNRNVALKVLKPELAAVVGAERFLVEIETTANLQHPHILPLFDSGEAESFLFYVMPFVEGETLRERIDRDRQLPVDEALGIATAVAGALQTAHDQGVIHRDIKPGNILLSQGQPLVADFGIAIAVSAGGSGRLTETGLSLGTPYYMSPEQATGDQAIGPTSDTFALACVLYEMLVGEPPYPGSTAQAVLGKIIQGLPVSAKAIRPTVPRNVDAAISKALEKIPADRFTAAQDFARALADPGFRHGEAETDGAAAGERLSTRRTVGFAATATVLGALAAWGWLRPTPTPDPGVPTRAEITGLDLTDIGKGIAISPDGRYLVAGHQDREGEGPALYIRSTDATEWRRLENTEQGTNVTFSPDGQWVAFSVGPPGASEIAKVPIVGGPRLPLADGWSPNWGANDTIVYLRDDALYAVGPSGGEPTLLYAPSDALRGVCCGAFLPNGKGVLFAEGVSAEDSRVMLLETETGEVRELGLFGIAPHYVPTGHLIYGQAGMALMGVPFDLEALQTTGTAVTLLPEVDVNRGRASQFAVSETGTLVYASGGGAPTADLRSLVWVDRQGREEPIAAPPRPYSYPRLSPDARRAAIDAQDETGGILIWDFLGETSMRLGVGDHNLTIYPTWTADGGQIAYSTGESAVYWKRSNNTGVHEVLVEVETTAQVRPYFITADETALVVRVQTPESPDDLVMVSLETDSVVWHLDGEYREVNAELSPDGRWMAYQSDETGRYEVYVRPFPQVDSNQIAISNNGGRDPLWSRNGEELFYLRDDEAGTQLMAVSFSTTDPDGEFTFRGREALLEWPYFTGRAGRNYDVTPDGQRFLAITQGQDQRPSQKVFLVANWFTELRERIGDGS